MQDMIDSCKQIRDFWVEKIMCIGNDADEEHTPVAQDSLCLGGPAYSSKQDLEPVHIWTPTGWSSGPTSVSVQVHQQWGEWLGSSS